MNRIVDSPIAASGIEPRRSFFVRAAAVAIGGLVALFPFAAGLGVLASPLRRNRGPGAPGGDAQFVRLGPLDLLPPDGIPRQFALRADVTDAWTRSPAQRVGSAFLSRTDTPAGPKIVALSSVCPHLGCAVDFESAAGEFVCPCHTSAFAKDGAKLYGPSLRGLDPLAVKLVENGGEQEIWVQLARFRTGIAERTPVG